MLRHIDSWGLDTAPYTGPGIRHRDVLIVLLFATLISSGFRSAPGPESLLLWAPPASAPVSVGLEPLRAPWTKTRPARPQPEAAVEEFADAWAAGDRRVARRVGARGSYRDLTRLANRFALAPLPTGPASAICSGDQITFCRVYLPDMLEVDARLVERHGDFVVLGFKLPAAG
jgi:hypothetical protein